MWFRALSDMDLAVFDVGIANAAEQGKSLENDAFWHRLVSQNAQNLINTSD